MLREAGHMIHKQNFLTLILRRHFEISQDAMDVLKQWISINELQPKNH